ncbi:sigma-70 family RNA polymerase sigma factor [Parablastomonas sp. CN1-191]|uniref:sigma-70 family RNA polymerase sigma factor n=1 Tax=Parablastomonas sp. CN1-191 TaxID=3400908 RepID=UPI003BF8E63F
MAQVPGSTLSPDALRSAMQRLAEGDRAALRTIYSATSAKLLGICLRILGDRAEAEDALQDVYVSLWNRAGSFDPERASPISWLATFARNRAIDRLRSRRRLHEAAQLDEAGTVADDEPLADALLEAAQSRAKVQACLAELDEPQRESIRSAFFDGASYPELATRRGVPLGTMKSWIRRGLARLKACIER